ncbi:MAG TPA: hypothetical protein VK933_14125, partial [Longimicrobiales bacterium]|nr:hypothetical protein [Longimicrobiales bacterium]
MVLAGLWSAGLRSPERPLPLDSRLVAILPFRVSGEDAALAALQEGMVDLLELRLDVQGTLKVASPRSTVRTGRDAPGGAVHPDSGMALARRLGAGLLLSGSVVGLPGGRVQLSAALERVANRSAVGRATVAGSADSLLVLVDGLAAQLLGLGAGEEGERLFVLGNTPLPAVHSYLAGRIAERSGRFGDAARSYDAALQQDSTFVFAAVRLLGTLSWVGEFFPAGSVLRALGSARAHRHRLGPRDQLRAGAYLGGSDAPAGLRSQVEYLERAVAELPDDPEMWYQLGDLLLHQGAFGAIPRWRERATAAFDRALRLDSAFIPAVTHRFQLAFDIADTTTALALVQRSRRHAPGGVAAEALRWAEAVLRADSARLASLRASRFAGFDEAALTRIVRKSGSYGLRIADGQLAGEVRLARAASAAERARAARALAYHYDKRGHPEAAAAARRTWRANASDTRSVLRNTIYALMSDGNAAAAAAAARELAGAADAPLAPDPRTRPGQLADLCAVALWRLSAGQLAELPRMASALRSVTASDPAWVMRDASICAATVETGLAAARGAVTREDMLRLDSTLTDLPFLSDAGTPQELRWGNLLAAELWARHGDTTAAFAALQRRGHTTDAMMNPIAYLRMECRLAMAAERPALARSACERFLAIRDDPEPPLRTETEQLSAAYKAFRSGR